VEGARSIADACAQEGVERLIHVSALNASAQSPSHFLRSKHAGELAVREAFAEATIVRPATMYGSEDRFLNRIAAGVKYHFMVENTKQRIRPVCVFDVAQALEAMMTADNTTGKTFELVGPKEHSMEDVEKIVSDLILTKPSRLNLPKPLAMMAARILSKLPWPTIAPDEIVRQHIDDVVHADAATFADLMMEPAQLEDMALQFVRGYRSAMYYELATETAQSFRDPKPKGKVYHTM
jgi:NADH dehydrogenase (ubiquinone) 1 alpha subcomplex subunit 9